MRRLLIVRTDAIGDAILWNGALPGLRSVLPGVRIGIACREAAVPVYETAPEVDEIFPIDIGAIAKDPSLAEAPASVLSGWEPDLLLHPTRSREKHTESLIARVRAGEKIALSSDLANCTAEERARFDAGYDRLIPTPDREACELDRHADVLAFFGFLGSVRPRLLLSESDRRAAAALVAGVDDYAVLAPSARWPIKHYPRWAEAIRLAWADAPHPAALIAVGGADATRPAEGVFAELSVTVPGLRTLDLTGDRSLRTVCGVLEGARMCIGNDTFTAHAAAALGVASATVVGGGHFGRFLPYDPRSVVATMPLSCGGCHWRCRYERAHCVKDLPAETVADAIRLAATPNGPAPRVVTPEPVARFGPCGPFPADLPAWIGGRTEVTISRHRLTASRGT